MVDFFLLEFTLKFKNLRETYWDLILANEKMAAMFKFSGWKFTTR